MNSDLTVNLNLNGEQRQTLHAALKGTGIVVLFDGTYALLNKNNIREVRTAVVELFRARFAMKSKSAQTLSICYDCERIADKIDQVLSDFGFEVPTESLYGADVEVIESTPSLTKVEEVAEINSDEVIETIPSRTVPVEKEAHWLGGIEGETKESTPSRTISLEEEADKFGGNPDPEPEAVEEPTPTKRKKNG